MDATDDAVLLGASLRLVVLPVLGRDGRDPVARTAYRSRASHRRNCPVCSPLRRAGQAIDRRTSSSSIKRAFSRRATSLALATIRGSIPSSRSADGKLHKLRVETYGGASWLTEFSVLAGVSTFSFGGMRPFVQSLMQGKVQDTVPGMLARCGYRNTLYFPMNKDFVSSGRFLPVHRICAKSWIARPRVRLRYNERDRFYYDNVLANLDKHFKDQRTPAFNFIITAATHLPYVASFMPEINVPGGGPSPQMHEYLRRVGMAKMDYDYFRAEARARAFRGAVPHRAVRRSSTDRHSPVSRLRRQRRQLRT